MSNALDKLIALDQKKQQEMGTEYTAHEIRREVRLWKDTTKRLEEKAESFREYISSFLSLEDKNIILTGAGTSEYVGLCVDGLLRRNLKVSANVISSTQIITDLDGAVITDNPTMLVSFARSGNSPESVGVVELAEQLNNQVFHLVVTCNGEGELLKQASSKAQCRSLVLHPDTNDNGLAMTSSFTNMVVAGQALSFLFKIEEYKRYIDTISAAGDKVLASAPDLIEEISALDFKRAVFLGNGAHFGAAKESHLKLQEMTSGDVMCAYDSFLGLRHGPEAVVQDDTLVVALLSEDGYRRRYEMDMLEELKSKKLGMKRIAVCGGADDNIRRLCDYIIEYGPDREAASVPDDLFAPVSVIPGQLLGLFKSLNLGYKPDAPSAGGVINRVVEGVKVYDPDTYYKTGDYSIIAER